MENEVRIPNAKKWTPELVTEYLERIKYDSQLKDVDYLGIALIRQGLYLQIWAYWKKIFADNDDIMETMMMIESICEAKLVRAALNKEVSHTVAIFILKHKHHWQEGQMGDLVRNDPQLRVIRLNENTVAIASERPGWADVYQRVA